MPHPESPINRPFALALLAAALGVLAYLAWHMRAEIQHGASRVANVPVERAGTGASSTARVPRPNPRGGDQTSGPIAYISGADQESSLRARGSTSAPAASGPRPLTVQNEERLDVFAKDLTARDGAFKDLLDLVRSEPRDPDWSDDVERRLQQLIAFRGARYTAIQTRPPRCSRTVCILVATGSLSSDAINADWQKLMGAVMNDPWFSQTFGDTRTALQGDAHGMLYITFFVRKD